MNLKLLKVARFFHLIKKEKYKEKRQIEIVRHSPFFDEQWYLEQYPDVRASGMTAAEHYVKFGWKEGRNPGFNFDTNDYLREYPELFEKNWCPLFHYMLSLKDTKPKINYRDIILDFLNKHTNKYKGKSNDYKLIAKSKYFDKLWYLKTYPDVKREKIDPIEHYMKFGWKEGRNPGPKFSTQNYLDLNADVKKANINPLVHYERHGKKEGRLITEKNIKLYYNFTYCFLLFVINLLKKYKIIKLKYFFDYNLINKFYKKIGSGLKFKYELSPEVSIIIPAYNQYKYTMACLFAILKYTKHISYEIVLIDDNSTDETKDIENRVKNITIIHNKKNMGFLFNCNKGVQKARGKYILLLNNDIIVTPNWINYLLHVFKTQKNVGAVGGETIFPSGLIQESGRYICNNGLSINEYKNLEVSKSPTKLRSVHYCSGCLLLLKKGLWSKIGGFDNCYAPAYYEDNDLCMTIREKLKLKIFCEPKCKVIHFHNVSYNASSNVLSNINREKFLKKWEKELNKDEYKIKLDKNDRKKILDSIYFDEKFYSDTYHITSDALDHYINIGYRQGYNPSPHFNTQYYLENNPDVQQSGINPLVHFIQKGNFEGRSADRSFLNRHFIDFDRYLTNLKEVKQKKILFITHSFSLTGAPLAVFETACFFKSLGWHVSVVGFDKQELINNYIDEDIPVFYGAFFFFAPEALKNKLSVFDFIFANTVLSYKWVRIFPNKSYLWRISEGKEIFTKFQDKLLFDTLKRCPNIYAVSNYTKNILQSLNSNIKLLLYGIKEYSFTSLPSKENKIVSFLIIGNYCHRKGQDIVLNVIPKLLALGIHNFKFVFMGANFNKFSNSQHAEFVGVKKGADKYKIIQQNDVLLCPSLDDPNPQVVMEGMMMHKPCIVTDCTGQKDIIKSWVNGWVIKSNDERQLINLVSQISKLNKDELHNLGKESYKLYQKYFTQKGYFNSVLEIIKQGGCKC